jgi:hypothetical protein
MFILFSICGSNPQCTPLTKDKHVSLSYTTRRASQRPVAGMGHLRFGNLCATVGDVLYPGKPVRACEQNLLLKGPSRRKHWQVE